MNKKLKIYNTVFVLVLFFVIKNSVFHYWAGGFAPQPDNKIEFAELPADFETRDSLPDGGVVYTGQPMVSYELNVKSWSRSDHKTLLSTAAGQTYQVNMEKIKVSLPASKVDTNFPMTLVIVSVVVSIIVFVWILWLVIVLLIKIRKGEVFVTKVSKYLEIMGFLLSFLYLFQYDVSYLYTQYMIDHIQLADHSIIFKNECNSMYILTGLTLLIISQIILMGKDLKDEQELTI